MRIQRGLSYLVFLALPAIGVAPASSQDAEPITFGLVEDSTGPAAPYATVSGRAFRAAVDYVNANGGILDRQVEIVVENDESDPTKSPAIARKQIENGADILFFATGGAAVMQTKPVVREAEIPAFAQTTITGAIASPPENEFFFSLGNPNSDVTTVLCDAWKAVGVESVALMADGSATIDLILKGIVPAVEACVELTAQERAPADSNDVTAQIIRLKSGEPDAVLVVSNGGPFEAIAFQAIKQQMPETLRFSTFSLGNQPNDWKIAAPGSLEGVIYTSTITLDNPRTKEIADYFGSKIDGFEMTAFDAWAWDAVQLAKAAIEKAGGTEDGPRIRDAIYELTGYEPHFGQDAFRLTFSPDKHIGADGLCGVIMNVFGADNRPSPAPWPDYQPECGD